MVQTVVIDIAAAYLIDLAVGDPYWLPHPVRGIGWLISQLEAKLRSMVEGSASRYSANDENKEKKERIAGGFLAFITIATVFLIVFLILEFGKAIHPVLYRVLNIYFIYSSFAGRCLANEAMKVYKPLAANDLPEARKRVAMLVGRETENLNEKEVTRAVVETTAENTVDGVISPIIYAITGSFIGIAAPVVYAFKAASTLDSMVGYMNEKYINFGRISAKFDDVVNYIPARLSGLIIPLAAFLCGKNFKQSFKIMLRDRRNHKSPNCAYPESAAAGALGIRIGGNNIYFGKIVKKPTIGDAKKEIEVKDIKDTVTIMLISSAITLIFGIALLLI